MNDESLFLIFLKKGFLEKKEIVVILQKQNDDD